MTEKCSFIRLRTYINLFIQSLWLAKCWRSNLANYLIKRIHFLHGIKFIFGFRIDLKKKKKINEHESNQAHFAL